jgi:hypothetical protein
MPTFPMPGVSQSTSSGPVSGGLGAAGLTTALIGAFPFGPAFDPLNPTNCLVYTGQNGAARFGSELLYNDLGGYGGPPALAAYLAQAAPGRNAPVALVIRSGLTQAFASIATASTITAVPTLGGADGNGTTFVIATPVGGNQAITITPPSGNVEGLTADAVYSVATGATWATVAAAINGQSKNVTLNIVTADAATAIPSTVTTYTLAGGTAGANPTASQINAATDLLGNVAYRDLPINAVMPLFSDTATSGVTLHALNAAIANIGNGQRARVFGSVDISLGQGSAAVAAIVTLATGLQPSENGGDSGRCMLIANNFPFRVDPASVGSFSAVPRRYWPYVFAAAVAGMDAARPPDHPRRLEAPGGLRRRRPHDAAPGRSERRLLERATGRRAHHGQEQWWHPDLARPGRRPSLRGHHGSGSRQRLQHRRDRDGHHRRSAADGPDPHRRQDAAVHPTETLRRRHGGDQPQFPGPDATPERRQLDAGPRHPGHRPELQPVGSAARCWHRRHESRIRSRQHGHHPNY